MRRRVVKMVAVRVAFEFGPVLAFFVATEASDIYWGTGVFMAAAALGLVISAWKEDRVPLVPIPTLAILLVLGSVTIAYEEAMAIMILPTIVNGMFGLILVGGVVAGRPLLKLIFADRLILDDTDWRALSLRLGVYLLALAVLNEVMWRTVPQATWVSFKAFGIPTMHLVFIAAQYPFIARARIHETA